MKNIKIYIIVVIAIFNIAVSENYFVEQTRFENFWKRTFKQMTFREPISFMPYNLKVGYFFYGGSGYLKNWNNILLGEDSFEESPFDLSNNNFPDISSKKYRKGLTVELDFLRYNFFKKYQNIIDAQIGFGYKYNKIMHTAELNGIRLQPNFQDLNINLTLISQWNPKFLTYLYYSYGLVKAHFYDTALGKASGDGYSQGLGLGVNFVSSNTTRKKNLYGLELRFENLSVNDISEPSGFDFINSFDMEKIGLIFSFGIGYGGNATLGDESYKQMLAGDYISALQGLQKFQYNNRYAFNTTKVNEMIDICRMQIPYQLYDMAMENYYSNQLQDAMVLLNKASYNSKDSLKYKIENQKYIIATEMIETSEVLFKNYSIDDQIDFFKGLENISNQVNEKIGNLLIMKGDMYKKKKQYELAYEMYMRSIAYDINNVNIVNIKLDRMATFLLNDSYKFLQNKEYIIAFEHLSLIKYIAKNNNISKSLLKIVEQKLQDEQLKNLRGKIKIVLNKEKEFNLKAEAESIYLGDDYLKVIESLGSPNKIIEKKKLNEQYELLVYKIDNIKYRLFFKNKVLIDVERE